MKRVAVMKEATSIKALTSSLWCVCVTCVCEYIVTSGVTVWVTTMSEVWSASE